LLGGALLGICYLADDRAYWRALGAIPRERIWYGLAELGFTFGCLAAYAALWDRLRRHRVWHRLLAVAGASNAIVHFPALFTIVSVLSTRGSLAAVTLDRSAYRRMLIDGEVLARVAHVWLAAAAVTGIVVIVLAMRTPEGDMPARTRQRHLQGGARLALIATVLQFPAGVWVVLEMPEAARQSLIGGDWLATALFAVSLLLAVQLAHLLWSIAIGDGQARQVRHSVAVIVVLVLLMVGTRLRVNGQNVAGAVANHPGWRGGRLCQDRPAIDHLPLFRAPVAFQ
jgi:hypothetical protein